MVRMLLVDFNNLVSRAVHVVKSQKDDEDWVGRALTIIFHSMRRHFEKFQCDHAMIAVDSWSWREELYDIYKVNRKLDPATANPRKIEAKKIIHRVIDEMVDYFQEETNVTLLKAPGIEADDFIARWVQVHDHPELEHVIFSNDSDFKQLVRKGVDMFDPLPCLLYCDEGILYQDDESYEWVRCAERYGETWKVKVDGDEIVRFDPAWELFSKCVRGDPRDNIKPAYPRVGEARLREAYADWEGPKWKAVIDASWTRDGSTWEVRPLYELNRHLIDLSRQPEKVVAIMDDEIEKAISRQPKQMVASYFESLCNKYRLDKLADAKATILPMLASPYRLS